MQHARLQFFKRMSEVRTEEKQEKLLFDVSTSKGKNELRDMSNYIPSDVLGKARNRLMQIIKEYQDGAKDELSPSVVIRAELHGKNPDLPRPIQELFLKFAQVKRSEEKHTTQYAGLWRHLRFIQFLKAHLDLKEEMSDPNGAVASTNVPAKLLCERIEGTRQRISSTSVRSFLGFWTDERNIVQSKYRCAMRFRSLTN
jgi:hypothetical protein